MSKFVVVTFSDEAETQRGIRALKEMHAQGSVKLYASSVVTRNLDEKLSVQEITNGGLGGTAAGALIGGLAGLPAGPLAAMVGAAGGAVIGNSADLIHQRAEVEFANDISPKLAPGKTAIVAEIDEAGVVSFEAMMEAIGGTVVRQ